MAKTRLKLRRAGGSLVATVPRALAKAKNLRPGDAVVVEFESGTSALDAFIGCVPGVRWDREWTRGRDRF